MNIEKRYNYLCTYNNQETVLPIDKTKSDVEQILKINEIREIFLEKGFQSYYDFYFLNLDEFRKILQENEEIESFFYEKTGKAISKISRTDFLNFIEIFFEKNRFQEVSNEISLFFQENGINYLNFPFGFGDLQKLKDKIYENNKLKYFFMRLSRKNISDLNLEDILSILKKLGFKNLENKELFSKIRYYLRENKIIYLNDLNEIPILKFENFFENEFINFYFLQKGIYKSFLTRDDLNKLGEDIGLLNYDYRDGINLFLKGIKTYDSLIAVGSINEIRDFLAENRACLYILKELKLDYLKDFRLEHIQKFARRIGLEGVPKVESYDEENAKEIIKNIFEKNRIKDLYTLKFYGVKKLRKGLLMKKNIGKVYDKINIYIKDLTGKTIPKLESLDLEIIGKDIGLYEYTEQEQKDRFLRILKIAGVDLDTMIASDFKRRTFLWKYPETHYVLEKSGCPSDKKLFRTEHLGLIRQYFEKSE